MEIEKSTFVEQIKKKYRDSFIISLLLGIFAIILLMNSDNFMNVLIQILGYGAIFLGILSIVYYFRLDKTQQILSQYLQNGVILSVFGCITFMKTAMIQDMLTLLLGGYLLVRNASRVQMSLYLRNESPKLYVWLLVFSLINVFLSFLLLVNPFENKIQVHLFMAIMILITESFIIIQNLLVMFGIKVKVGGNINE